MNVGIITCWYKNISMANYSYNLIRSLEKHSFIKVKVVSSRCFCEKERYCESKNFLQDDCCQLINFPPFVYLHPQRRISWVFYTVIQVLTHFMRGMIYLSKCKSCDVIHYQLSAHSLGILPLIPMILIPTPNKKIITSHTIDKTAGLRFLKAIYNKADKVLVHSEEMRKDLISIGVHPSKIGIIPHGAKIPVSHSKRRDKITFFGAPIKQKGVFVLFEALKILKDKGEKIKVYFYGIYSASEKEAAYQRAKELDVDGCIVWGGRLSENDFDVKMQESMFTFAIYTEPVSGSSILTRAMANATPIIATNIGGLPEYSQKFAVLIPPNNPEELARAILMLKNDHDLRMIMSEIAREEALKISWDVIAEKTLKVYLDALKN
ncbi:MAG: glycosyltransferase family 4 protein [Candidatus Bathyarchaeia archaeon]